VATTQAIHHVLATAEQPEEAVAQLIELANQAGGPDNIACARRRHRGTGPRA
jgi:protein phosphatase